MKSLLEFDAKYTETFENTIAVYPRYHGVAIPLFFSFFLFFRHCLSRDNAEKSVEKVLYNKDLCTQILQYLSPDLYVLELLLSCHHQVCANQKLPTARLLLRQIIDHDQFIAQNSKDFFLKHFALNRISQYFLTDAADTRNSLEETMYDEIEKRYSQDYLFHHRSILFHRDAVLRVMTNDMFPSLSWNHFPGNMKSRMALYCLEMLRMFQISKQWHNSWHAIMPMHRRDNVTTPPYSTFLQKITFALRAIFGFFYKIFAFLFMKKSPCSANFYDVSINPQSFNGFSERMKILKKKSSRSREDRIDQYPVVRIPSAEIVHVGANTGFATLQRYCRLAPPADPQAIPNHEQRIEQLCQQQEPRRIPKRPEERLPGENTRVRSLWSPAYN